jgi:glycosyltransferase involved in cell wall biosynthesis
MKNISSTEPFFTVVIATYNAASCLGDCLSSIREQTYKNFELIIADGGSHDGTLEVINEYQDIVSKIICEEDEGIYDAWNKALEYRNGAWVLFLGADDALANEFALEEMQKFLMEVMASTLFVFSEVLLVESVTNPQAIEVLGGNDVQFYRDKFLKEMLFSHTGCLHRDVCFQQFGFFNKTYKIAGDYEFLLRCVEKDVGKIDKFEGKTILMGQGGCSTAVKTKVATYKEAIRARSENELQDVSMILYYRLFVSYVAQFINSYFGNKSLVKASNLYRSVMGKAKREKYE